MKENPAYAADKNMLEKLKKIGVEPGKDFDPSKASGVHRTLVLGGRRG